jgi:RNA polymerase sigma-70 factor (ECF subfamily)
VTDGETIADYYDELLGWVWRKIGHRQLAEDLTGEVFVKAFSAIRRGRGPTQAPRAWLFRIAHNLMIDYFRRRTRVIVKLGFIFDLDEAFCMPDAGPSPEHLTLAADSFKRILEADDLTADQHYWLELMLMGYEACEIAGLMDRSIRAISALRHRTVVKLRDRAAHPP